MAGGRSLPVYSTGTVTVAQVAGVWTVSGVSTNFIAPDGVANYTLLAGDMFVCAGGFGTIANIASASSLTLDFWFGATISTATAYKIYRYEGLPSQQVSALVNLLLTLFTDSNPAPYATIDTGAVRFKFDDDGSGDMRLRVRQSSATDSSYATALIVNALTGALSQAVVDAGGSRIALLDASGTPEIAVGPAGTAVGSLLPAVSANKTTGVVSFPQGAQTPADWGQSRLINGTFDIWQIGASGTTATNSSAYLPDCWLIFNNTTGQTLTGAKASGPSPSGRPAINLTMTSCPAGANFGIAQRCESSRLRDLAGGAVAISYDISGTTTAGSVTTFAQILANTAVDNSTWSTVMWTGTAVAISSSFTRVSFIVPASATAALANGAELLIYVQQNTATGNPNVSISGVSVEQGAAANNYPARPIVLEWDDCERFFQTNYAANVAPGTSGVSGNAFYPQATGNYFTIQIPFRRRMKAAPTLTLYSPYSGASGYMRNATTSADIAAGTTYSSDTGFSAYVNNVSVNAGAAVAVAWAAASRL